MSDLPVLWHVEMAHFSEKVRWAFDYKGVAHVRNPVFGIEQAPEAAERAGTGTLPIVDFGDVTIGDSTAIIAELERRWPDPPLYPADATLRAHALELEEFFDEHCAHEVRRVLFDSVLREPALLVEVSGADRHGIELTDELHATIETTTRERYAIFRDEVREARTTVAEAMDRLESELGEKDYLAGESFSVADLTAAAIFAPLLCPPEFPYHQADPETWPAELQTYREGLVDRRGARWVLETYARHRGRSAEALA